MSSGTIIGIDGGGTGSRATLADAGGIPVVETTGGPLNPYALSSGAFEYNLRRLCEDLLQKAGARAERITSVGAGMAGVRTPEERTPVERLLSGIFPNAGRLRVTHDLGIALRGATSDGEGVMIVAGTGSAAHGRWRGRETFVGGWGQMLGDEGSGYEIGIQALRAVVQAEDGRSEGTALRDAILNRLGLQVPRDLVSWCAGASKAGIAALAKIVLTCAGVGDRPSLNILDQGAAEIARMASTAIRRLKADGDRVEVALGGGLMTPPAVDPQKTVSYFHLCRARILREAPDLAVIPPRQGAVQGAVLFAMED